jgi:uncharacterized membrane protein
MVFGPIFALLAIVGIVAIFIWMVQLFVRVLHLVRDYERRHLPEPESVEHALDVLERRLVNGEIDCAEFEEKHKLLAYGVGARQNNFPFVPGSGAVDDRTTIAAKP